MTSVSKAEEDSGRYISEDDEVKIAEIKKENEKLKKDISKLKKLIKQERKLNDMLVEELRGEVVNLRKTIQTNNRIISGYEKKVSILQDLNERFKNIIKEERVGTDQVIDSLKKTNNILKEEVNKSKEIIEKQDDVITKIKVREKLYIGAMVVLGVLAVK